MEKVSERIKADADLLRKYGNTILDINTPIIGVFGVGEKSDKYNIQMKIRNGFLAKNYKVSQIIVKRQDSIEDSYDFPFDIFSGYKSDSEQICIFNNFAYEICKINKPDLLLVEIPSGIVQINKDVTNNFGVLAYKVSNAINFDVGIMNLFFESYSEEFFKKIEELFLIRFSIDTVYFNLHNKRIDWMNLKQEKQLRLMTALESDLNIVKNTLKRHNLFILKRESDFKEMINDIEAKLAEYSIVDFV